MAEQYKLTYFNGRGVAEPIRYLLALAGVNYDDHRIEKEDWPVLKPSTRWGQLPLLQVNGDELAQSIAIGRYLARKHKLAGESPMEEFRADELIDCLLDLKPHMRAMFLEQDETKKGEMKKTFIDTVAKPFLEKLVVLKEKNGGKWMVGQNVTWADLHLAHGIDYMKGLDASLLDSFPVMLDFQQNVFGLPAIKKWIETRPQTEF